MDKSKRCPTCRNWMTYVYIYTVRDEQFPESDGTFDGHVKQTQLHDHYSHEYWRCETCVLGDGSPLTYMINFNPAMFGVDGDEVNSEA